MECIMTDSASEPLDETDRAILEQVQALHAHLDPPPADLTDRVRFAMALENVDVEVARLVEDMHIGSGARGTARTRTITFNGESRTIVVTVVDTPDRRVRVDGWLAPAARLRVEMRLGGEAPDQPPTSEIVVSDDSGRFAFHGVAHGLAQFLVHPADGGHGVALVTPALVL
jgi:hypothetical protein